jgi:hypothetical protein
MKGVVMITSCYASSRPDKLLWVRDLPLDMSYVFIRGRLDLDRDYIYNNEGHECILKCSDQYLGLPEKIKMGFNFVSQVFNPDYVIKVDDDVIVNVPKLIDFLKTNKYDYVGNVSYSKQHVFCCGPIYYLSKTALESMKNMSIDDLDEEDLCVGRHAALSGIPIHNVELYTNFHEKKDEFIAYHDAERIEFPDPPKIIAPPPSASATATAKKFRLSFLRKF